MSPLELAGAVGAVTAQPHTHAARYLAAALFVALLLTLSFGLQRAKKQVLRDDAEAALEADFLRLERELARHDAVPGAAEEAE